MKFTTKDFYTDEEKRFVIKAENLYEVIEDEKDSDNLFIFKGRLVGSLSPLKVINRLANSGAEHLKDSRGNLTDEIIVKEENMIGLFSNLPKPLLHNKLIVYEPKNKQYFITPKVVEIDYNK